VHCRPKKKGRGLEAQQLMNEKKERIGSPDKVSGYSGWKPYSGLSSGTPKGKESPRCGGSPETGGGLDEDAYSIRKVKMDLRDAWPS